MKQELNSLQIKTNLTYMIKNNVDLAKKGKNPIAIEIEGMPGTAKTSVVKQVAELFDFHYVRLNLAECEPCDLIGLPIYEYEIKKGTEARWVSDKVLTALSVDGWNATGNNRTSYSKPSWIQGKEDKPVLFVADDYNRATPMMVNACMTIIDEQKFISWSLPKGSTVILTCNPGDQDFMVQSEDSAQTSRRLKFYMKASVDVWASEFAEGYGVDDRCINFMLKHPEIIEGAIEQDKKTGEVKLKGNLRSWTKYFDAISGVKDFTEELDLIMNLGMGSLPQEHIMLFVAFINKGLDKLPTPQQLLTNELKWSLNELKSVIKEGKDKRQDLSAIMTKRLLNYGLANSKEYTEKMVDNYREILESDLLSKDLCIITMKKLCTESKFKGLVKSAKLVAMLTA